MYVDHWVILLKGTSVDVEKPINIRRLVCTDSSSVLLNSRIWTFQLCGIQNSQTEPVAGVKFSPDHRSHHRTSRWVEQQYSYHNHLDQPKRVFYPAPESSWNLGVSVWGQIYRVSTFFIYSSKLYFLNSSNSRSYSITFSYLTLTKWD